MERTNQKPFVDETTFPKHQASSVCEVVSVSILEAGKQSEGKELGTDEGVSIALKLGHMKAMPKSILKPLNVLEETASKEDGGAFRRTMRRHSSYNAKHRNFHKAAHEAMKDLLSGVDHLDDEQSFGELVKTSSERYDAFDFKNAIEQMHNESMAFDNLELLDEDKNFAKSCPAMVGFYDDEEDSVELVKIRKESLGQSTSTLAAFTMDPSSDYDDFQINKTLEDSMKDNDIRLSGPGRRHSFTVPLKTAEEIDDKERSCRSLQNSSRTLKLLRDFLENSKNGLIDYSDSEDEDQAKDTYELRRA